MFRTARLIPVVLSSVAVLVGATVSLASSAPPTASSSAPVIRGEGAPSAIPDSYVVKLKDTASVRSQGIDGRARALNDAHRGKLGQVWQHALHGFSTTMTKDEALRLASEPDVESVVQDQHLVSGTTTPAQAPPGLTQTSAPWGLDRIDQHALPLDTKYSYDDTAGQNVRVYILSSGIDVTHPDFGGRAIGGPDYVNDGNPSTSDCTGAGTWLAGIIGGAQYGVAKKASMVSVRTTGCDNVTSLSRVANGFNWVTANAALPAITLFPLNPYCIDLSTGELVPCDPDTADTVVEIQENAFDAGIVVVGMAGDLADDTCANSSGAAPSTIYVGATASNDALASTSNFGPCVTMYAPGDGITTDDPTGTRVMSGTILAAAFVAGTAALFAGKPEFVGASPAQIGAELVTNRSTPNIITGLPGNSENLLLFTGPPGLFTIGDSTALTLRSDGRLELFGVNKAGYMFHRSQTTAGNSAWTNWTQSAAKGMLSVGVGSNADGRIALLGMTPSGELWVRQEAAPNTNSWYIWTRMSGTSSNVPISRAVMAHNRSNRLQIFVTDHQGKAYFRSQLTPGSNLFTTWNPFSFTGKARDITAVPYADGRIEVLTLDDAGQVWRTTQTSPTDTNWSPFTKLNGFGMASITAARNLNGTLELVGLDTGGGAWRRTQTTIGTWGNWTTLSAKTLSQITAGTNANGRVQVVGVDNLGKIWQSTQTTANSGSYTSWSQLDGTLRP